MLNGPAKQVFCCTCQDKIHFITDNFCPICGIPFLVSPAGKHICSNCLENEPYYTQARAVAAFETVIMDAIHKFKYGHSISTGNSLGSFMAGFSFPDFNFSGYSLFIPVPLHIKRLRERGFNQSLLLANKLGRKYNLPVNFSLLKRCKSTLTQTGLKKAEREKNVKGAFFVTDRKKVAGENIILIDDVYTTGATLNECAGELLKSGAQKVAVLTLSRVAEKHA
ncbi:MAG: amidophosphoribosyltransferase [Deltaproteobacteria bacterium HGW-Deltaproteobacteria-10]|nr:MAG: amidophosphoribosyltransferase [Deltaproteobacteria bacterium HGW-Deltaproteobacteria-10]